MNRSINNGLLLMMLLVTFVYGFVLGPSIVIVSIFLVIILMLCLLNPKPGDPQTLHSFDQHLMDITMNPAYKNLPRNIHYN